MWRRRQSSRRARLRLRCSSRADRGRVMIVRQRRCRAARSSSASAVIGIFTVALLARTGREFYRALADSDRHPVRQPGPDRPAAPVPQDALSDAIESLPEAIAIYDADDRLVLCNRKYARRRRRRSTTRRSSSAGASPSLVRAVGREGRGDRAGIRRQHRAHGSPRGIRRREEEAGREPRMYRIGDGRWMLTGISRTRGGRDRRGAHRTSRACARRKSRSRRRLDEQELIFEAVIDRDRVPCATA